MSLIEIIATIVFISLGIIYTVNVNKAKKESKYCCGKGCAGCTEFKSYHKKMD